MPMLKLEKGEYDYRHKYIQFDFTFTEESKNRDRKDIPNTANVTINIKNIGQRELLNLYVGNFEATFFSENNFYYSLYPILYANDTISLNFSFYEKGMYDNDDCEEKYHTLISPMTFNFFYKDCLDNWYVQKFSLSLMHSISENIPIDEKALNIEIERINIETPPHELLYRPLPWECTNAKITIC